jgi:hypothetical protein
MVAEATRDIPDAPKPAEVLNRRHRSKGGDMKSWRVAAVSALVGALVSVAASAVAGTGIGGVFNLGAENTVAKTTILRSNGSFSGPQLRIKNDAGGAALDLHVNSGKPPLTVDSTTEVANLNADLLDGLNSTAFARSRPAASTPISGTTFTSEPGKFVCYGPTSNPACFENYLAGYGTAAYSKDAFGFVHLTGLVKCIDNLDNCPYGENAVVFYLPVGFRPAARLMFPSLTYDVNGYAAGRIDVRPDGAVVVVAGDDVRWVTLDGITFPASQ